MRTLLIDRPAFLAQADAAVLSTVDRETLITVRVPRSYEQPLQWLTTISSTIVATVPSGGAIPSDHTCDGADRSPNRRTGVENWRISGQSR